MIQTTESYETAHEAGVYCVDADHSNRIVTCLICGNEAGSSNMGGGVYFESSAAVMAYCTIADNEASYGGGGIAIKGRVAPALKNCVLSANVSYYDCGGAVNCDGSSPPILNCTIAANRSSTGAGGVYVKGPAQPAIHNTIFQGNRGYAVLEADSFADAVAIPCLFDRNYERDFSDHETGEGHAIACSSGGAETRVERCIVAVAIDPASTAGRRRRRASNRA